MARYRTELDITAVSINGQEYEVKDGVVEAGDDVSVQLQELGFTGVPDDPEDPETPEASGTTIKKGMKVSMVGPNNEAVIGVVTSKTKSGLVKVTDAEGTVWSTGIDSVTPVAE